MLVWMCGEQRGRRSGSTRGLPGGLPEGKERTESQPEGGQGGRAAGGEPGEAAVAQGEGGTEPRCPRYRTWSGGPEAEETSHRMSWGTGGSGWEYPLWKQLHCFLLERPLRNFLFLRNVAKNWFVFIFPWVLFPQYILLSLIQKSFGTKYDSSQRNLY